MGPAWKEYEEQAAAFFQRLGFHAEVNVQLDGIRSSHKVDVLVTGVLHGIAFRWVVECKAWKTNVPKEKVMALVAIVQDVGADRGFLLSEVGFQSGAIRAARLTNVTLSSVEDLMLEAEATLAREETMRILHRRGEIQKRLWRLHKATGNYMSEFMPPMGEIAFVDFALDDGLKGAFPVVYAVTKQGDRPTAADWKELVTKLNLLLDDAEAFARRHEQPAAHALPPLTPSPPS